jgi:thiol-disulfide isomerase/thioredoxin
MKPGIVFTFIALSLLSLSCKKNEVVINGEISDIDIIRIEYAVPINDVMNGLMTDSVKPDASGKFSVTVPFEKLGFIILRPLYKTNPIYRSQEILIAEPGKNYTVSFGSAKDKKTFLVRGEKENAQNEYNKFGVNVAFMISSNDIRPFIRDSIAFSIHQNIITRRDKDIALFKGMFEKGEISNEFLKLIQIDRTCYYALLEAWIYQTKFARTQSSGNKIPIEVAEIYKFKEEMNTFWEDSYKSVTFNPEEKARSPWWFEYYRSLTNYKIFTNNELSNEARKNLADKNLLKTFEINNGAKKYLPAPLLESYFANYIFSNCFLSREIQDHEVITLYNQFVSEYPQSKYTKYLTPWVNENIKYEEKTAKSVSNEKIKFLENYQSLNTLKDCLKQFSGKKVYIDVWASWCGSCRMEFSKHEKLREILKSKGIELLYISMDEDKYDKNWKDLITYYNLEGYHVRVNKKFSEDLIKLQNFNGGAGSYVPWHIMIDEEGKMMELPGDIAELVKESK